MDNIDSENEIHKTEILQLFVSIRLNYFSFLERGSDHCNNIRLVNGAHSIFSAELLDFVGEREFERSLLKVTICTYLTM